VVLELQTAMSTLQKVVDSIAIDVKQGFSTIWSEMKKQQEMMKKLNEEVTFVKHSCTDNSSRSTSPETKD
jgi:hypothetical protein